MVATLEEFIRLFCWRLPQDPLRDLGQAGDKREAWWRSRLPEGRNRPPRAKPTPPGTRDLPPKALPGLASSSATHILTQAEGQATRGAKHSLAASRALTIYTLPSSRPPPFPDQTLPPRLKFLLNSQRLPTKTSPSQLLPPTSSADDLPSVVSAPARTSPPGPGWDAMEVSGYRSLLMSFRTLTD